MNETWDEAGLRKSIPKAREEVELAARVYANLPSLNGESHRPVVELAFYLARLDYDIKVLLHRLFTDPDNRTIWERYLALELYEALKTVPKAVNRARMQVANPRTASGSNLDEFDNAAKAFKETVKAISKDKVFMESLSMVRNGVAAHHGLNKGKSMDERIAWTFSAWQLTQRGHTPFESQIAEYAVKLGRAIQELGQGIVE